MGCVTFACVRTGTKYGWDYVARLKSMIGRHYRGEWRFLILTDLEDAPRDLYVDTCNLTACRNREWARTWWAKMALFDPADRMEIKGSTMRTIYLDLDTVICGDLTPLVEWSGEFGICSNFTREAGHTTWPCRYGSCVMSFAPGWGQDVFDEFMEHRESLMRDAGRYGDQMVIEQLVPFASLLQPELPAGFFLNKRDLPKYPDAPPPEASVVVFGGNERPDNCKTKWIHEAWR